MTKILILGAGNIGKQIAKNLHDDTENEVTLADIHEKALQSEDLKNLYVQLEHIDTDSKLDDLMKDAYLVMNALPHTENKRIASLAHQHKTHYFDLSEDVESTNFIKKLALGQTIADKDTFFMPQCGLAPGFINVLANGMIKGFDEVYDVKMRVGALPLAPSNAFKYNFTWSVDGLINEYINDANAIENGNITTVKGMEGLEHITIDGIEYEAFNTSGGAGSMIESLHGRTTNVNYKTLRYPGHRDLMNVLLKDLKLENDRTALKTLLTNAIPSTKNDVVIVYVSVTGLKDGKYVEEVKYQKIYGDYDGETTAIQKTTAAGICIAVDLFRDGKLPDTNFLRQEDIDLWDFTSNRYYFGDRTWD